MDQEVEVKDEPVWLEGTTNTSLEYFELLSEIIPLKQEIKSELTDPGPTQENIFKPSADIEQEILVEQHTVHNQVPYVKEENKLENVAELTVATRERPYRCEECGNTFTHRPSLRNHMVIHTGERRYCCKQCGSTFIHRRSLRPHMVIHTGDRLYRCEECGMTSNKRCNLKTHIVTHTGERPYNCTQCSCTFIRKDHLRAHMITHTGERPYRCDHCNTTLKGRSNLRRHMLIHTRECQR